MTQRQEGTSSSQAELMRRVQELKAERNAIILVHNYQLPEVQDVADHLGDSLGLSRTAAETDADVIVFCGVHFMAETAAILSPQKTVLMPDERAGCPMAEMITPAQLEELKRQHPGATVVTYVNSTAEIKAMSDYCCTSANSVKVLQAIDADEIIFIPDKWLAMYSAQFVDKTVHHHHGYCPTHHRILPEHIERLKRQYPKAIVVCHPECRSDVVGLADEALSTSGIVKFAKESNAEEFIIATEIGILYRLEKENPGKRFYGPSYVAVCPNMKLATLEKIVWCLEDLEPRITVPEETAAPARQAIDRMLELV